MSSLAHRWLATRCRSRGFSGFSATVSRAKSSWPGACSPPPAPDLATLRCPRGMRALPVPITGVISGRPADEIRQAVAHLVELPLGVPHQLCQASYYLRYVRPPRPILRSGPRPCQERTEEADPGRRTCRSNACGEADARRRCRGRPSEVRGLLRVGGAVVRLDRRRATAAGGLAGLRCTSEAGNHRSPAWTGSRRSAGTLPGGLKKLAAVRCATRAWKKRPDVMAAGACGDIAGS